MGFVKDFKAFLLEKDIVAYAVAFIMALALKNIVNSVVDNFVMPVVSLITGGTDFTKMFVSLDGQTYATLEAAREAEAAVITYGFILQAVINFIVIGLVIFLLVKMYEKTKKKQEAAPPPGPSKEEVLLTEIRDELKKRNA